MRFARTRWAQRWGAGCGTKARSQQETRKQIEAHWKGWCSLEPSSHVCPVCCNQPVFFCMSLLFSCKTTSQQALPLRRLVKTASLCYCLTATFSRRPALAGQTASVTISVLESVDRCRQCSWAEAQRAWRWSKQHSRVLNWTLFKDNTQWRPGVAQVRLLQANLHQTATHCTFHKATSYRSTEPSKTCMQGRLKGPFLGLFSAAATTAC